MNKPYKRPTTSIVFECIGGAAFVAGLFAFIAAYVDASAGHSGGVAGIAGAICVIMAAVYVGIGQVIDYLARASHRGEQIAALLTENVLPQLRAMKLPSSAPAPSALDSPTLSDLFPPPALNAPLENPAPTPPLERSAPSPPLENSLPTPPPALFAADSEPEAAPSYFYSQDGKEEGPFSATELKTFRKKGVIKDTTPIFRTGDKDWLPLRQFPDLVKS